VDRSAAHGRVQRIVVAGGFGGLHLVKGHIAAHHVAHAVANDGHHVAVFDDVGFIAEAAVPGHDDGSAFFLFGGNGEIEDVVQRGDEAVYVAAMVDVHAGIACRDEDIA